MNSNPITIGENCPIRTNMSSNSPFLDALIRPGLYSASFQYRNDRGSVLHFAQGGKSSVRMTAAGRPVRSMKQAGRGLAQHSRCRRHGLHRDCGEKGAGRSWRRAFLRHRLAECDTCHVILSSTSSIGDVSFSMLPCAARETMTSLWPEPAIFTIAWQKVDWVHRR